MSRESCVKHPARNPTVVLRDDYLKLCDGNYCAAMILSQHEHWHNVKLDSRQQASEHNLAAVRSSEAPTQDTELWVYMAQLAMKGQLMGMFGDKAITDGYKKILDKGYLLKRTNPKYTWDKTLQYLFNLDRVQEAVDALAPFTEDGDYAEIHDSADLQGSRAQKCAFDAAEMRHAERKDADCKTQKCATPKTSSETSYSETSTENPHPPEVPFGRVQEEEDFRDKATEEETSRIDKMIEQIAKITATSIEIGALRPLALECVRREHKDAWTHTLSVLKAQMACDKKPTMPNRYAASVLANALESPVPKPKPQPKPAPPVSAQEPAEKPQEAVPEPWAMRQARKELTHPSFKTKHGRPSDKADWTARAWELQAAVPPN